MTNNMLSFPNRLLYLSEKRGGLNYTRFSDYVQRCKFSFLERMMIRNSKETELMLGIISREAKSAGNPIFPGSQLNLTGSNITYEAWWLTSCLEWLAELNLTLVIPGVPMMNTTECGLHEFGMNDDYSYCDSIGMITVSDKHASVSASSSGAEIYRKTRLRIGQCWVLEDCKVFEILSFWKHNDVEGFHFQSWSLAQGGKRLKVGSNMVLDEGKADTACLGVRSNSWLPLHVIGNRCWLQVFLSKEDHLATSEGVKVREFPEGIP
jgi:hypothetical protein